MLDQEMASVIKHVLDASGSPTPYYDTVPQDFLLPAAYFPRPEIVTGGDTLSTYRLEFMWFINIFDVTNNDAWDRGFDVINSLVSTRNVVQLINTDGGKVGSGFRLRDPSLKRIEDAEGVVQLTLGWNSSREYYREQFPASTGVDIDMYTKESYNSAVEQLGG